LVLQAKDCVTHLRRQFFDLGQIGLRKQGPRLLAIIAARDLQQRNDGALRAAMLIGRGHRGMYGISFAVGDGTARHDDGQDQAGQNALPHG
jgi:hypothetical protein